MKPEIHPATEKDPKFKQFKQIVLSWINSNVIKSNLAVKDLVKDLRDGQVIAKLLSNWVVFIQGQITGQVVKSSMIIHEKNVDENWQNILGVLRKYDIQPNEEWTIHGILNEDIISIFRLLVEMSRTFPFPYQLPSNLSVSLLVKQVLNRLIFRLLMEFCSQRLIALLLHRMKMLCRSNQDSSKPNF